jgi:hypothetical protein
MSNLLGGKNFGIRRGAAHGLAGVVKGLGVVAMRGQNVLSDLLDAIQDKDVSSPPLPIGLRCRFVDGLHGHPLPQTQSTERREGALMAFEMLCTTLGRMFEPYVKDVLPHLLVRRQTCGSNRLASPSPFPH